jgi:RHH-type rel operon transcriptional repressor/antitoxin RelB
MTVSVRMDPLLEQQLESAAKRQGMTKSQFIVDAVQRALGHKDAYRVLSDVQREYGLPGPPRTVRAVHDGARELAARQASRVTSSGDPWRADLHARHGADMADWLAYQAARKAGKTWSPPGEKLMPGAIEKPTKAGGRSAKPRSAKTP